MRQPERISSFASFQWLILGALLVALGQAASQYASSPYNGHFDGYNQQSVQQLQQFGYADTSLTYNPVYPAPVQSRWSGAPIVVNDEANVLDEERQQRQERQYFPINYYNNREPYARPDSRSPNWINSHNNNHTPTRAANHNYDNGAYHYTQPQQELESRELLTVADSRRPENQIVHIGGSRSLANSNANGNNYEQEALPLSRHEFQAKYAKHYSDYLRKYPYRLQPYYNTFDEK